MERNGKRKHAVVNGQANSKPAANGVVPCEQSLRAECNTRFRRFAQRVAEATGSAWSFLAAILMLLVWGATGPLFHYSDTWQLVINTVTTVVTFLMVFLIQNTQNRDAKAIHLKLDELIHAAQHARNKLISLEQMTDEELDALQKEFERARERAVAARASKAESRQGRV